MSVAIRLKRHGTRKRPFYRIVVMDSRRPRDGRVIEEVGRYQPTEPEGAQATVDEVRVREWIGKGARPSPTVRRILNRQARGEEGQARGEEGQARGEEGQARGEDGEGQASESEQ
jgi:small subunit ribosomal protein S16